MILASCGTPEKNGGNETKVESNGNQHEKNEEEEIKEDTSEVMEKDNSEQVSTKSEDNPPKIELSDEEIEKIVADTYLKILFAPEDPEASFYEAVQVDLMNPTFSIEMDNVFVHGLDPESALYQTIYDFFHAEMQQHVTEVGMNSILADLFILLMIPRNETPLSPTFNQFQVLEKSEDEFVVKHWFEGDESSLAYETTFVLADGNWKFLRAMYTNR